jgi:thiol-disulfide isomerase/thioredoxin
MNKYRNLVFRIFVLAGSLAVVFSLTNENSFAQTKVAEGADQKSTAVKAELPKVTKIDDVGFQALLKPANDNAKPMLINFWATWCDPCREEFPDLVKIDQAYRGKIDFITISLDDLAEIDRDVPQFLNQMNAKMPAYLLSTNRENEVIGSISREWSGGLPFSVLYDEKRNIVLTTLGKIKFEALKSRIDNLLSDKIVEIGISDKNL